MNTEIIPTLKDIYNFYGEQRLRIQKQLKGKTHEKTRKQELAWISKRRSEVRQEIRRLSK